MLIEYMAMMDIDGEIVIDMFEVAHNRSRRLTILEVISYRLVTDFGDPFGS